jgi:hypothetical protein
MRAERYTMVPCRLTLDSQKALESEINTRGLTDPENDGSILFANLVRTLDGEWGVEVVIDNERFPHFA